MKYRLKNPLGLLMVKVSQTKRNIRNSGINTMGTSPYKTIRTKNGTRQIRKRKLHR